MSTVDGEGAGHRGLIYRSSQQLVEITAPMVVSALEGGRHVVVLSQRWYGTALRDALRDRMPRHGAVDYRSARALSHGPSPDLGEQLRSVAHADRPTLVISQFVPPPTELDALPCTVLPSRSTTLLCLCPVAASDDVRASFHRAHQHLVEGPTGAPARLAGRGPEHTVAADPHPIRRPSPQAVRSPPTVRVSFGTVDDLSGVRAHVGRAAATAGLDPDDRARAVLAVHEAMVVACNLVLDDPAASGATKPCQLQAYATPSRLVTEIDLPRSISFPAGQRDRDPLAHSRAFCHQVSWFGSLRTRHIRLITLG